VVPTIRSRSSVPNQSALVACVALASAAATCSHRPFLLSALRPASRCDRIRAALTASRCPARGARRPDLRRLRSATRPGSSTRRAPASHRAGRHRIAALQPQASAKPWRTARGPRAAASSPPRRHGPRAHVGVRVLSPRGVARSSSSPTISYLTPSTSRGQVASLRRAVQTSCCSVPRRRCSSTGYLHAWVELWADAVVPAPASPMSKVGAPFFALANSCLRGSARRRRRRTNVALQAESPVRSRPAPLAYMTVGGLEERSLVKVTVAPLEDNPNARRSLRASLHSRPGRRNGVTCGQAGQLPRWLIAGGAGVVGLAKSAAVSPPPRALSGPTCRIHCPSTSQRPAVVERTHERRSRRYSLSPPSVPVGGWRIVGGRGARLTAPHWSRRRLLWHTAAACPEGTL